jgi:hypothetical protein
LTNIYTALPEESTSAVGKLGRPAFKTDDGFGVPVPEEGLLDGTAVPADPPLEQPAANEIAVTPTTSPAHTLYRSMIASNPFQPVNGGTAGIRAEVQIATHGYQRHHRHP